MQRRELIVRGPTFLSQGDEAAFFTWLKSITCVADVAGRSRDLHIELKRAPSNGDLRELIGLLYRYRMNMKALATLKTTRNATWFGNPGAYWYSKVFGRRKRLETEPALHK